MAIPRGLSNEEFRRRFFKENPNFFSGGSADVDSLSRADRRNPQFRDLLASGQLLPAGNAPSVEDSFLSRLNAIGAGGLLKKQANVPQEFIDSFNQFQSSLQESRGQLSNFARDAVSGGLSPFTTSKAQRGRLIDRAESEFGRILDNSLQGSLGFLSQRGLLPETTTGFSGPAAGVLADIRAKTFEDPLTSFVRDLDINTEADLVANRNRLRELGVNVEQFLAGNANQAAQTAGNFGLGLGNLELNNINSQRGFANNLLSQIQGLQNFQFQQDAFERDQRLLSDSIFQAEDAARQQGKNRFGGLLGNVGGTILGGLIGGPVGAGIGGSLGSSLGGGSQGFSIPQFFGGSSQRGRLLPADLPGIPATNPLSNFNDFNLVNNPNLKLPTFGQTGSFF